MFHPLPAGTAGADGTGTDSAVRGVRGTFTALLASPAVLAVDDAHLLDGASAAFVHQLAVGTALPLVVTIRSGEPEPDAVTALWKDGHLAGYRSAFHGELAGTDADRGRPAGG